MADADFRCEEQAGERGNEARQQIGAQMNDVDMDAVPLGRLLAKADGANFETAARAIEPDVADNRGGENDEEGDRGKTYARLQYVHEVVIDRAERRRPEIECD